MEGFLFIVFSALMHSLWNVLLKKSDNKYVFNYQMHVVNLIIFTVSYPIVFSEYLYFDVKTVGVSFVASLFFSLYHLCLSTAYRFDDASKVYPVTVAAPFFVLMWAVIFLNEEVSLLGVSGIIIIVVGVIVINGRWKGSGRLSVGMLWALGAAFFYSIGSVIDKVGVGATNFPLYVYSLSFFMTVQVFLFSLRKKADHLAFIKNNYRVLLVSGVIIFLSFLSFRIGLVGVKVTYASALRQVSVLFGVALGVLFLKERFQLNRVVGASIIMVGVILIRLAL